MFVSKSLNFPLYLFLDDDEDNVSEPFTYHVKRVQTGTDDDGAPKYTVRVICNDIPCGICQFSAECQNSKHRVDIFTGLIHTEFPETLI